MWLCELRASESCACQPHVCFQWSQPADSGAGSEESSSAAAEETPVGEVDTASADPSTPDGDWQLAAPPVGDAAETPAQNGTDDDADAATDDQLDADSGAGAEESASQVPLCALSSDLALTLTFAVDPDCGAAIRLELGV